MSKVRTRFAPSPTGTLHIGGGRTALFNKLLAMHHGGQFVIRIEDTDKARSTQAAVDAITEGLGWLGLSSDEPYVYQSAYEDAHREAALKLLAEGKAYKCFASTEELDQMRAEQEAKGEKPRYDRRWRNRTDHPAGVPFTVRIKLPEDGYTVWNDAVQGEIRYPNAELDDFIILRADGSPIYNLAVVIDDINMNITHVIRGDDHINNTPKQIHIYNALGATVPVFGHVPLIHGDDGKKLSKRHGAVSITEFREQGYLPEAVCNYLMQLSWSYPGGREVFSVAEAAEVFDINNVNKGAATFNTSKLRWLNAQYMRALSNAELMQQMKPFLPEVDAEAARRIEAGLSGLAKRAETLIELVEAARIYIPTAPALDEKAQTALADGGRERLNLLANELAQVAEWNEASLDAKIKDILTTHSLKMPQVGMPLRAALVGTMQAPGVGELLSVFGKEESLRRIRERASA